MSKELRKKLEKEWRDVSWWDEVRSWFNKTPATFEEYDESYCKWLNTILDCPNLEVTEVREHTMKLQSAKGYCEVWIANYPYSYGKLESVPTTHHWWYKNLDWGTVIKLRELQMTQKAKFFSQWDSKRLSV